MALLVTLFSFGLIFSSSYRLYSYFSEIGKISSAGELLNSTTLTSALCLIVGLGLIRRTPWGRIGGVGIALAGAISGVLALGYIALNFQSFMASLAIMFLMLKSLPVFMNNMLGYIGISIGMGLLAASMCYFIYRELSSDEALIIYNDELWFGRILTIGSFDLRPLVFTALFFGAHFSESLLPKSMFRTLETKQFAAATKVLKQELEKDPAYVKQQDEVKKSVEKKKLEASKAVYMTFTQDETKIWVVTSDYKVHLIDLRTFTNKSFIFGAFHSSRPRDLSPDGSYFFHPDKKTFTKTADSTQVPIGGDKREFLGFTDASDKILVYDGASQKISLTNLLNQEIIWETPWTATVGNPIMINGVFWSADRKQVLLAPSKDFFILDVASGKITHAPFEIRFPEFTSSNRYTHQMLVSGPPAFDRKYRNYMIDTLTGTWTEIPTFAPLIGFDPGAKTYTTKDANRVKFLSSDSPATEVKSYEASYDRPFLKAPGEAWTLKFDSQNGSVAFDNIDSGKKVVLAKKTTDGLSNEADITQAAVSPTGKLWITSARNHFEIFWTSELAKEKPRSWKFNLEITH